MTDNLPTINYSDPKVIETLKKTVAVGASDAEFYMFAELCKSTGLNPFKKECWFLKVNGRVQIMTGVNGFFTIANRHGAFDGYEWGFVAPDGTMANEAYPKDDFIGAWAKVYRKDRKVPTTGVAMLKEYDKRQGTWNQMKRVMIQKCAESVALRKAFPQEMNGLYTEEEMPEKFSAHAATEKATQPLGTTGLIVEKGDVIDPETGETLNLKPADQVKSRNPKSHSADLGLMKLYKDGEAFVYDAEMMAHVHQDKQEAAKKALGDAKARGIKYVFLENNTLLVTSTPIKDLEIYLLSSPDPDDFDKDSLAWEGKEQSDLPLK
jgi:phage recombination protein Bet